MFMKKWVVMFSIFFVTSGIVNAQSMGRSYKTALGVKVWDGGGISFKTFVAPNNAMEVIGYFYRNGTRLTGLYEIHGDIADAAGLKWYIGPGAHLGFYNYKGYSGDKVVAGVDGVLGLDYKVNRAPINFSIDWQPSFEFAEGRGFVGSWGGLGIRYAF
ncbi:MAG: hypothetical protein JWR87_222 [Segetibacter sp.]|jgi:hypothetical protein|nr:hypothetical protein [Segetibacter sp.]